MRTWLGSCVNVHPLSRVGAAIMFPFVFFQDGGNLEPGVVSFSQPAKPEQLLLSSQMTQGTQASQTPLQRLVKRMTRMLVKTSLEDTVTHLEAVFNKLNYSHRCHTANVVSKIVLFIFSLCLDNKNFADDQQVIALLAVGTQVHNVHHHERKTFVWQGNNLFSVYLCIKINCLLSLYR